MKNIAETQLRHEIKTALETITTRFCKCYKITGEKPCRKSLKGFAKHRKYHPECEKKVDKSRRVNNKKAKKAKYRLEMHEEFLIFHKDNPHVLEKLKILAIDKMAEGHTKYGFDVLWGMLRWDYIKTTGKQFKLNNNYKPHYTRLMMEYKRFKGFFNIK